MVFSTRIKPKTKADIGNLHCKHRLYEKKGVIFLFFYSLDTLPDPFIDLSCVWGSPL